MLKHQSEIEYIITSELGFPFIDMKRHTSYRTIIQIGVVEVFIKNDITPQEFREKVASAFINMLEHLLIVENNNLQIIENKIKRINSVYRKYYPEIQSIMTGEVESLNNLKGIDSKINVL